MRRWSLILLLVVLPVRAQKAPKGQDIFQECLVPELQLQVSDEALEALNRSPRRYVRVTVREGQKSYTNVALRLKGGPGSYRPLEQKPAFTLNFEKFAEGQTFHGLKKIHLNNSVQDGSYLHEKISRELMNAAGVPAPRAGNAWVSFNGDDFGMYVVLEGVNKQFLKRYFKDPSGPVYDGHSGSDVTRSMPINEGEKTAYPTSRLHALAEAISEPDLDRRGAALQETLDIDRFLSFVGMELILGHWDGYTIGRNNFRVYHDRDTDRMVFLPHGMDQVLSRRYPIIPQNVQGAVARSLFEMPEMRKRYRERYAELCTNVFLVNKLTNLVMFAGGKIQEAFARHDKARAAAYGERLERLSVAIARRGRLLESQIIPVFDGIGVKHLTNWTSKLDKGDAKFSTEKNADGKELLHIATESGCTASWRTAVDLPPGEYRFQARIKTKGVTFDSNDPRDGAGLRVSRYRTGQKNAGDHDWMPISFDFMVPENGKETELVCELRAREGEIWYDLSSLKVIRK